jgi:hypothetical protein
LVAVFSDRVRFSHANNICTYFSAFFFHRLNRSGQCLEIAAGSTPIEMVKV